jgi:hypothetical protein
MVLSYGKNLDPITFDYLKINPQKNSRIITKNMVKRYIPVCQKGIIDDNFNVFPFGYNK